MNMNNIGLKLADGEFYPVLTDGKPARKRLVVTTVQDGQPSVQIDLYRGQGPTVKDADYIGSLVVEDIPKMAKGGPDIRLDLGLAKDGTLTAFAQEASTGASQSLKVSLEALSEEQKYEVPDFEFSKESDEISTGDFSDADFEDTDSLPPEADSAQLLADVRSEADAEEAMEKPRRNPLGIILVAIGIFLVLLIIGYLVYKFVIVPRSTAKIEPTHTVAAPAPSPGPRASRGPRPGRCQQTACRWRT